MGKQPYTDLKIVGGFDKSLDPVFLADTASPNLQAVRFDKGLIRKDFGANQFGGNTVDGYPGYIGQFILASGSTKYMMATNNWVYEYDVAGGNYSIKNAANQFSANADDLISATSTLLANGGDVFIITNGKDGILKYTGSGNCAALGGANAYKAGAVVSYKTRVLLGQTIESGSTCPRRVRWSCLANPEDWANTGSGFLEIADTGGWVTGFGVLKDRLFTFKEDSVWEISYVGGTTVFTLLLKSEVIGCKAPKTIATTENDIIFLGLDDVYCYDGFTFKSIGEPIKDYLFKVGEGVLNISYVHRATGTYMKELGEYWLCVPTNSDIPNLLLKYSFTYKCWTKRQMEATAFGRYLQVLATNPRWIDGPANANWTDCNGIWMAHAIASGSPSILMGRSAGAVYEDNRLTTSTETMFFETKDWIWEHASRVVEIRVMATGGAFTIFYSTNGGVTWGGYRDFAATSAWTEFAFPINLTTQRLRVRVQSSATSLDIKWIEPWFIPRKKSKTLSLS